MNRTTPLLLLLLAAGCAGGARLGGAPEPSAASPATVPAPSGVVEAPAPLPVPATTTASQVPQFSPSSDSFAIATLSPVDEAADSADMAVLERLAESRVDAPDSSRVDGTDSSSPGGASALEGAEVTYDIDVSTYGTHARVQYYLDFFQGPARDRFSIWLQRMPRYEPMIRAKLRENGVPEDMVYLALIESGFSNSAVSRSRATGMWQFMKGTGKLYGLRVDSWLDERRDPVRATDAAARHLADLRDQFGSMYLAAAAYNAGAGRVGRGLRRMGDVEDEEEESPDAAFFRLYDTRYIRRETKDYVPKLIAAALIAKQPERYGFPRVEGVVPLQYDSVIIPDATGLDVIARLADTSLAAIHELNPQFIRRVTPPKREVVVRLPPGSGEIVAARYEALPARERVTFLEHTVARGQTISGIAASYHVSTRLVLDANPGVRPERLRTGMRLVIPTSYVPATTEPALVESARAPRATSSTSIRYRVRSGESLWSIADDYNTTVAHLRQLNGLGRTETLRAGQVIRVPAPAAPARSAAAVAPSSGDRVHTVTRGETLSGIAQQYRVSLSALREANGMSPKDVLKTGTRLRIP